MAKGKKATKEEVQAANDMLSELHSDPAQMEIPLEPLPGEDAAPEASPTAPVNADSPAPNGAAPLNFAPLPEEIDRYGMQFVRFDADGDTVDCRYIRRWAPGQREGLEYAAIEVVTYPEGDRALLPGNSQLWEAFGAIEEAGTLDVYSNGTHYPVADVVFRVTRTKAIPNPKNPAGPPKFVQFSIRAAYAPR